MLESTGLIIVLVGMSLVTIVLSLSRERDSVYSKFFLLLTFWLVLASFDTGRQTLNNTYWLNSTNNIYNNSGVRVNQENITITQDVVVSGGSNTLLDSVFFVWMWITIVLTVVELLHFLEMLFKYFRKGG